MKQLFFIRHGQTEWNAEARMQGQWDSDLNETGRKQAKAAGEFLEKQGIQELFASPQERVRQTVAIINQHLSLPVTYDDRLKEWNCGDWSGYLYADVEKNWPEDWAALLADPFNHRGPNCENYPDLIVRALPFLQEIKAHPAETIAIASHGMIGKVMVSRLLELDETETLEIRQPNNAIFRLRLNGATIEADHYINGEGPKKGLTSTWVNE